MLNMVNVVGYLIGVLVFLLLLWCWCVGMLFVVGCVLIVVLMVVGGFMLDMYVLLV